jgi:glucosamine--fructose-6-phosphate aminotransferase (isomerizing)
MFREAAESGTAVQRQLAANRSAMRAFAADLRARAPRVVITSARGS